jgi:hypothetical protein
MSAQSRRSIHINEGEGNMNGTEVIKPAAGEAVDKGVVLSGLLGEVIKTSSVSRLIGTMVPAVIAQWAGKNPFKKIIAGILGKIVGGGFIKNAESKDARDLSSLLGDPEIVKRLGREIPAVMDGAMEPVGALLGGIESLSPEDKCVFLGGLLAAPARAGGTGILTSMARIINDVHARNPHYFSETMRPAFASFLGRTDFGELKELLDGSSRDLVEITKMVNEEMWKYPAKVICVLSMIPSLFNTVIKSLRETMEPINGLAPDLLTDVVLALIRDIDGSAIGAVINQSSELVRKIHTGSTLIGEQGKPQFPVAVNNAMAGVLSTLDVNLLLKARSLLAEIKEVTLSNFIDLLGQSPVLAREYFQSVFRSGVAVIRSWSRKAEAFEMLFTDEEIAGEFAKGMGEIDAQQLGETISRLSALLNGVRKNTPGVIRTVLTQVMGSIDSREFGETFRWLTNDVVRSIKPLAPEILPPVIRGVAELLSTDQYDDPGEIEDALATLRKALVGKEVAL